MLTLFYGTQVVGTYPNWATLYRELTIDSPIYQEGYVWDVWGPGTYASGVIPAWYSCDGCPRLLEDVPKELRTLVLLLNL